jgi:hypothetical protein
VRSTLKKFASQAGASAKLVGLGTQKRIFLRSATQGPPYFKKAFKKKLFFIFFFFIYLFFCEEGCDSSRILTGANQKPSAKLVGVRIREESQPSSQKNK